MVWKIIAGRPVIHNADGTPHRCKATATLAAPAVPVPGKRIVGANYKPVSHASGCKAAPWEECDCEKVIA